VFDALRRLVRSGLPWRYLANDFPRWEVVYQQTQRWLRAGCFEMKVHDLRLALRVLNDRTPTPTVAIYDSRTLSLTPQSGKRAGCNGHKKTKDSKVHIAVDILEHLLALKVTPVNQDDRTQVEILSEEVQKATGQNLKISYWIILTCSHIIPLDPILAGKFYKKTAYFQGCRSPRQSFSDWEYSGACRL
jgi:transposase